MWVQGRYAHTACHVAHCHRNLKNTHMDGHSPGVEPCAGHHTAGGLMGVPARASQATHEVAVDFETMVNGVLTRMSNDPDIDFTWTLPLTHM